MNKGFSVIIFLVFSYASLYSQEIKKFVFNDNLRDTVNLKLDYAFAGNHFLGSQIANKFYRMQETYTYIEKGTPTSPSDKTVVQKPVIFYAVKKLNPYYKKAIKKGEISEKEAIKQLGRTLDLAYVIFNQNTTEFEAYLKENKNPEETLKAFEMIKLE